MDEWRKTNWYKRIRVIEKRGGHIEMGSGGYINPGSHLRAIEANIIIGDDVRISFDVFMITNAWSAMDEGMSKDSAKDIIIGDNCEICQGAKIRGGVTIGNYALVAMGSVVLDDVPPFHMVAGVPAQDKGLRRDHKEILRRIGKESL